MEQAVGRQVVEKTYKLVDYLSDWELHHCGMPREVDGGEVALEDRNGGLQHPQGEGGEEEEGAHVRLLS